ncbi:Octicosapeptide/Phox/Bem1p family protein [Hirschfeldia incana]|nr:Octicosapeptide/Phox/Bem1p family protein [Hirschfeldia incana]
MEKLSYNSYPDSTDSSPRSREIDFDNPPPWDDHNHHQPQSYKVRFMCSYGGKIQPRPHDNQLTYVNGETKILSVDRGIRFPVLASKLSAICGDGDVLFKYQLPGEDLDALISVTNDDDLEHMMHEYDRLLRVSSKPARMRLFLFPVSSGGFGSEGSTHSDRDRFVEALNTVSNRSEPEKTVTAPLNSADFLFGTEKAAVSPPPVAAVPVVMEPHPPVIQPDHGVMQNHMLEFQRMQVRDQEQLLQQQGAVNRRKSEDGLIFSPPYAPPPQMTAPQNNTHAPPMTFWQGNHCNPGGTYPTTAPGMGLPEQPVYMIPSPAPTPTPHPGTVYHAPPQGVMRPGQGNQGGYYSPQVQRIPSDTYREQHQPAYNVAQPPVGQRAPLQQQQQPPQHFTSGPPPPQPQYSAVPPPRQVMGVPDTTAYTQVNYAGGMGKQVYYTEAPPPQYHGGVGLPVNGMSEVRTGPDGKPVVMNMSPKVSSHGSDSAV